MRSLNLAVGMAAVVLSAPAAADISVSPLADIYESYDDCFKVATTDGFKPEALGALGWSRGTMTTDDGKPIANGPLLYGHASRKPIIILSAERGICTVMARLENPGAFVEFKKAWRGKLPEPDKDGIIGFSAEERPIVLRQTGTADRPSLTISVLTPRKAK